ncbi:MAG: hypothetical protein CMJ84_16810 [Planctomycetes bacterium]|nr:hypothetical protein [Planctomycetota bacterium]
MVVAALAGAVLLGGGGPGGVEGPPRTAQAAGPAALGPPPCPPERAQRVGAADEALSTPLSSERLRRPVAAGSVGAVRSIAPPPRGSARALAAGGLAEGAALTEDIPIEELPYAELTEDLRDDDEKWNATCAGRELSRRLSDPAEAYEARRHLEASLRSDDWQEKRIAIGLLQSAALAADPRLAPYSPPEILLDLTVEQLDDWTTIDDPMWIMGDSQDSKSLPFAMAHLGRMERSLTQRLVSQPPDKRFVFAFLLGWGERRHLVDQIAPELVGHLRDNGIRDDALMSMEALYALGEVVRPWLEVSLLSADSQQRACIELLTLELDEPALTSEKQAGRSALNQVPWKCDDPVQSWRYRQGRIW